MAPLSSFVNWIPVWAVGEQTKQVSNEVENLIFEKAENRNDDACFIVAIQRVGTGRTFPTG